MMVLIGKVASSVTLARLRPLLWSRWFDFWERSRGTVLIMFEDGDGEKWHPLQC